MAYVGILLPPLIAMFISDKRLKTQRSWLIWLRAYLMAVLIVNLIPMIVLTYVLQSPGIMIEAFQSGPFFVKYTGMSMLLSLLLPYAWEAVKLGLSEE